MSRLWSCVRTIVVQTAEMFEMTRRNLSNGR
jgi:hypothetical protein